MQPDKWELHPEDFDIRMKWERERQGILDAQVFSLENKTKYPDEKIPLIPELKYPDWHLRVRGETDKGEVKRIVSQDETDKKECETCGKKFHAKRGDARYCSPKCRLKAYRG